MFNSLFFESIYFYLKYVFITCFYTFKIIRKIIKNNYEKFYGKI